MDFLLLLPENRRVVIEIDGKQYYSIKRSPEIHAYLADMDEASMPQTPMLLPSPQVYADTARSDRELQLRGYYVYRFGGYVLFGEAGKNLVLLGDSL